MQKIKISDYMLLSQNDRQSHIDLSTNCQFYYYIKDWGTKKISNLYSHRIQKAEAKRRLMEYLNIEEFGGNDIHLCHKCECNSSKDKVCINYLHLAFGTASENHMDISIEIRQKVGKIGGKKTAENGMTPFQKKVECPHCGKIGQLANMKRHHFDNCKFKK